MLHMYDVCMMSVINSCVNQYIRCSVESTTAFMDRDKAEKTFTLLLLIYKLNNHYLQA